MREASYILEDRKNIIITLGKGGPYLLDYKVRLYPTQGVISIIFSFVLKNKQISEIIEFQNQFRAARDSEYKLYLNVLSRQKIELKTKGLEGEIKPLEDEELKKGELLYPYLGNFVISLRYEFPSFSKPKYEPYYFHNYRTLFFVYDRISEYFPSNSDCLKWYSLLSGTKNLSSTSQKCAKQSITRSTMSYQNTFILSGDRVFLFLLNENEDFEEDAINLFDLAHTFWYFCQKWIFILPKKFKEIKDLVNNIKNQDNIDRLINKIYNDELGLHDDINLIQQYLIEVKDIDLMFYNLGFRSVMKKFYEELDIKTHIDLVEYNMSTFTSYHQRITDYLCLKHNFKNERHMFNINYLIAGSIGLSIASLMKDMDLPYLGRMFGNTLILIGIIFSVLLMFFSYIIANRSLFYKYYSNLRMMLEKKLLFKN